MGEDLGVLKPIFQSVIPVKIIARSARVLYLSYGFFYASSKGFESTILSEGDNLYSGALEIRW